MYHYYDGQYGVSYPIFAFFDSILIKYGVVLINYGVRLQYQGTESPVEDSPQIRKQIWGSLFSCVELARYIKPRLQNWIKAGGFHLYIKEKGLKGSEEQAEPFYIDLWEIIDKKEVRILDWRFVKKEVTPLDWYIETLKNVSQQQTNKKRKYSSNT
jgi:hypothetical protein